MNHTVWQRCSFERSLTLSMNRLRSCGSGPLGPKQPLILQASNVKAKQLQSGNVFLNVKMHIMFYEIFALLFSSVIIITAWNINKVFWDFYFVCKYHQNPDNTVWIVCLFFILVGHCSKHLSNVAFWLLSNGSLMGMLACSGWTSNNRVHI